MKNFKKAIVSALFVAATVGMISGCSMGDKFEGDWANEPDLTEGTLLNKNKDFNFFSPTLTQVHIEKKGDSYFVTQANYYYTVKVKENTSKKSGLKYTYPCDYARLTWLQLRGKYKGVKAIPGEKVAVPEEAWVADYDFMLNKKMEIMNQAATAVDNGTVLAVKGNAWGDIPLTYVEADKTLLLPGNMGGQIVLKKTSKDSLKNYMDTFRNKVKDIIAKKDQDVKDIIAADKAEGIMSVSGTVNFDEKLANK